MSKMYDGLVMLNTAKEMLEVCKSYVEESTENGQTGEIAVLNKRNVELTTELVKNSERLEYLFEQ